MKSAIYLHYYVIYCCLVHMLSASVRVHSCILIMEAVHSCLKLVFLPTILHSLTLHKTLFSNKQKLNTKVSWFLPHSCYFSCPCFTVGIMIFYIGFYFIHGTKDFTDKWQFIVGRCWYVTNYVSGQKLPYTSSPVLSSFIHGTLCTNPNFR
jgi:hypothetical protein